MFFAISVLSLLLAVLDFFDLTGLLEQKLDNFRDWLPGNPLLRILGSKVQDVRLIGWALGVGLTGMLVTGLIAWLTGQIPFDQHPDSWLFPIFLIFLFFPALAAVYPLTWILLLAVALVIEILDLLDKPKRGTVCSVSLILAAASFAMDTLYR